MNALRLIDPNWSARSVDGVAVPVGFVAAAAVAYKREIVHVTAANLYNSNFQTQPEVIKESFEMYDWTYPHGDTPLEMHSTIRTLRHVNLDVCS